MKKLLPIALIAIVINTQLFAQSLIVDHNCTDITQIPEEAITQAKQQLHIAYGHTSHGSQLTEGMRGLVTFMNDKGYTNNLYAWNNGGTDGALDLHDRAMGGDVGYYPDWVDNTRAYLGEVDSETGRGTGDHADVNVIIWSWCGQVDYKYVNNTLQSEYLTPMSQLEDEYWGVKFIYMTGHLEHSNDANLKAANQMIRDFCINNNKILYDFADIESYDPDGNYYEFANDNCNYYESATGAYLGNWAIEWQNSHTEGEDWYNCNSAHSEALNANQKAYAAWWLWASLAGWNQNTNVPETKNQDEVKIYPIPSNGEIIVESPSLMIDNIEVYNLLGIKIVLFENINDYKYTIDLRKHARGQYFIKIVCDDKVIMKSIIVN